MHRSPGSVKRIIVIVLAALLVVSYLGTVWFVNDLFTHRVERKVATPADYGLTAETVDVTSSDGVPIAAWHIPATGSSRGVVIILHGMDGSDASTMLGNAKFVHDAGYTVLVPDLRAHGRSGGKRIGLAFEEPRDVAAVLDWVAGQPTLSGQPVVLFGLSMGGAVAIRTAAVRPDVDAVISVSAFASIDRMLTDGMRLMGAPAALTTVMKPFVRVALLTLYHAWPATASPLHDIARVSPRPILLLHGTADDQVVVDNARALAAAAPSAQLTLVDGAGHLVYASQDGLGEEDAAYRQEVLAFLQRVTSAATTAMN